MCAKVVVTNPTPYCSVCNVNDHWECDCPYATETQGNHEQVNFVNQGNFRPNNNPYSNTYNPGWRNHPNFSWRNQNVQNPGNQSNQSNRGQNFGNQQPRNLENMLQEFMTKQDERFDELKQEIEKVPKHGKMLETQLTLVNFSSPVLLGK